MRHLLTLCLLLEGIPMLHGQVRILTRDLAWAIVGTGYQATIDTAVGGQCPAPDVSLNVVGGSLPRGLEVRGWSLAGVPKEVGVFHFALQAANICASAAREFDLIVTGKPILQVLPETLVFEYHPGDPKPKPQSVVVSSTWPNLAYSVSAPDSAWLQSRAGGVTPDTGSAFTGDMFAVQVDPGELKPGIYESALSVSAWMGANAPAFRVILKITPKTK